MIIAVDGPAASGKGTLARRLAKHFGLNHLDTGSLYRAVAFRALTAGADPADPDAAVAAARRVEAGDLADPRLREDKVAQAASVVAAIPGVRTVLLAFQRDFARRAPGAVLDGRDIGTVVCPDADAKIFLTATVEARASRRFKELQAGGGPAIYERVLQDMMLRDARDRERRTAPLQRAADAFELDTTALDADAAFAAALRYIGGLKPRR
ncbi:MAG TPA: (d)CMP kinase [Stellaceae bacterium]|nr:(d)CMP kinase [Alphaproteobacteria bacterium]HEV2162636.1 (d)CMP kinase [Stellaceae bacterium]